MNIIIAGHAGFQRLCLSLDVSCHMSTLRRITQLTILAIVFMVVGGSAYSLIEWLSGGRLERWRGAQFTGRTGDESLAIELAALPVVLAVLACWGVVMLFRLRAVQ